MSKLKEQLEVDIKRFLENIENQNENDKLQTLRNLFDKYLHLNTSDYLMDHSDLFSIISSSKKKFSEENVPVKLGSNKRVVNQQDLPNLFIIEATIGHLKKKDCLKKMAKFDKKKGK
jgi:hypothetical protein